MKVILYIGHHKVGSTALQVFLSQNWYRLARAGILYPSVESRGFSHNLARALDGRDTTRDRDLNIREPHSALAYRMMSEVTDRKVPAQFRNLPSARQMFQAIRQQVAHVKPKTLILCSEAFANFGLVKPELISRLRSHFPKAEFQIYCALRRPDDYLISWHGQRLKVGEKLEQLSDGGLAPYYDTIHFNFRTVVESWNILIPEAQLTLRPYTDILASGGSIEDFITQSGITFPSDLTAAGRANKSLPRTALEIVRRGNHDLPPPQAHALCQYLLSAESTPKSISNKDIEMFGTPLRIKMAARFGPVHDYLSELTGQGPFFTDFERVTLERPVPEHQAVASLLAQIDPSGLPDEALRTYVGALKRDYVV